MIETDHESLKWLLEAKSPARLVRWSLRLAEFDFEIKHKRGKANSNADCLSRLGGENKNEDSINFEVFDHHVYVNESKRNTLY